jgi:hypothetical protein
MGKDTTIIIFIELRNPVSALTVYFLSANVNFKHCTLNFESTPKSKYYATKAQKHKIAPKHVVDFQTFVRFRDLVY